MTRLIVWVTASVLAFCNGIVRADDARNEDNDQHRSTAEDFLRLDVRPIAIGHHGVGPYPTGTPGLPMENTVESVREAYSLGARVSPSSRLMFCFPNTETARSQLHEFSHLREREGKGFPNG